MKKSKKFIIQDVDTYTIPGYQKKLLVNMVDENGDIIPAKIHPIHMKPSNAFKPLNWNAFVTEALLRRKGEKISQKLHAALAQVSIPTMRSFEKRDLKLSLKTALKILKVVGL